MKIVCFEGTCFSKHELILSDFFVVLICIYDPLLNSPRGDHAFFKSHPSPLTYKYEKHDGHSTCLHINAFERMACDRSETVGQPRDLVGKGPLKVSLRGKE